MTSALERVVYRALFRLAKKFDGNPSSKSFIHRSLPSIKENSSATIYYESIVKSVLKNKVLYMPQDDSLIQMLRREARSSDPARDSKTRVETGLSVMRKFSSIWKSYQDAKDAENSDLDKRGNRTASLSKGFIPFIEQESVLQGHVLIAHPLLSGPLHRSIILILENTEKGTYGLVVNRPTVNTLHPVVDNLPDEFVSTFGHMNVAFGGMVRRLQCLHTIPGCGGFEVPFCSTPIIAGCRILKLLAATAKNPELTSEIQFFVGCCCWRPGQLEEEIDAGYWIRAQTEPDKIVALLKTNTPNSPDTNVVEGERALDVYEYAMEALGEKYRIFAQLPHWIDSSKVESL